MAGCVGQPVLPQLAGSGRVGGIVGVASQIFLTHIARRAAAALDILASNWKATRSPGAQMVIANANTSDNSSGCGSGSRGSGSSVRSKCSIEFQI